MQKKVDPISTDCVYFLISGDRRRIKIGRTTDLRSRVGGIRQHMKDRKIKILGCFSNITHEQSLRIEVALHRKFKNYRVFGEWFEAQPIQDYINNCKMIKLPPKDWGCTYYNDL